MYKSGSIVLIPFPYSDLSTSKRRPVLMLTQPDARGDSTAMPLTSKIQAEPALALPAGPLASGGFLPLASWVKTDTVFSLCQSQIIKQIGRLDETTRQTCVQRLCQHLHQGH